MREKITALFSTWGGFVARRPWPVLLVAVAGWAMLAIQIPRIVVDTTTEGFLHPHDPTLIAYNDFRARFGRDDSIVVGIDTPDLFTLTFLERLRDFHEDLEKSVPYVSEITSMLNARWTRGEDDQLIVEDLVEEWPQTGGDMAMLRQKVFSNPLYLDALVTRDGRLTTVAIDLDTFIQEGLGEDGRPILRYLGGPEHREVIETLYEVMERHQTPDFGLSAAGMPFLADRIAARLMGDLPRLTRIAVATIAVVLFVLFGQLRAVVLALVVVIMAVTGTLGLIPLLGLSYQVPTQIVPVSLLAIGVGDSVHILAIYYQRLRRGDDNAASIVGAFEYAGTAVLMTSLTTAAAMMSFLSAELAPVANLGILIPAGVMLALLLTATVLPALIVLLPKPKRLTGHRRVAILDRLVVGAGQWAALRPWPVLAVSGALICVALMGVAGLRFSHDPVRWFPEGDPFRQSTEHLNDRLGGVMTVEFLFETKKENGVQEPEFLRALEAATASNPDYRSPRDTDSEPPVPGTNVLRIVKTISIADFLKELNRALNENRPDHYVLPDTKELVAQELLLFEMSGSDDLEDVTDYEYATARMTMRVPWLDATRFGGFIDGLVEQHQGLVGPDVTIIATGRVPLLTRTITAAIHSMATSYVLALIAVTPLMVVLLGRIKLGLLAMVPNVLPIVAALGVMGWFDIPLDLFSLLIGSILIGLAVDDTIHFMNGFSQEYELTGDPRLAVRETLATTGQALFFTTLILCCGFSTYAFAYMKNAVNFGLITSFGLAVAFLADIVLTPALVVLVSRTRR